MRFNAQLTKRLIQHCLIDEEDDQRRNFYSNISFFSVQLLWINVDQEIHWFAKTQSPQWHFVNKYNIRNCPRKQIIKLDFPILFALAAFSELCSTTYASITLNSTFEPTGSFFCKPGWDVWVSVFWMWSWSAIVKQWHFCSQYLQIYSKAKKMCKSKL